MSVISKYLSYTGKHRLWRGKGNRGAILSLPTPIYSSWGCSKRLKLAFAKPQDIQLLLTVQSAIQTSLGKEQLWNKFFVLTVIKNKVLSKWGKQKGVGYLRNEISLMNGIPDVIAKLRSL